MTYQLKVTFNGKINSYHAKKLNKKLDNRVLSKGLSLVNAKFNAKDNAFYITVKPTANTSKDTCLQAFKSLDHGLNINNHKGGLHRFKALSFTEVK
jgi:hypothetical protein